MKNYFHTMKKFSNKKPQLKIAAGKIMLLPAVTNKICNAI